MTKSDINILIVEDNLGDMKLVSEMLKECVSLSFKMRHAARVDEALKMLGGEKFNVILLDLDLPDSRGLDTLKRIVNQEPEIPVIVLTGFDDEDTGVQALQKHAGDYLVKGKIDTGLLVRSIRYAIERKKSEQVMKEAVKIKSDFTSMVSHELRSPLAALKESISLALEGAAGELNEKQKELLGIGEKNLKRLTRLVDQLLDLQKIESCKMEFKMEENDINEVVRELRKTMVFLTDGKGLDLILDLGNDLPKMKFDKDRITQAMTNLISNAVKFTEKGSIAIATSREDNSIHVSVRDTGIGIKKEEMSSVFKRFWQAKREKGSTGLGLAITKEIIGAHQGTIWVESEFGKGSNFHFLLPLEERMI